MKSFKIASLAAGLAGIVALGTLPASAASIPMTKPAGGDGVIQIAGGHHGHHGGHHRHGGFRRGPGFGFSIGVPLYSYGNSYSGGGCGWLHRRAETTGSRYWWRRYRECRGW